MLAKAERDGGGRANRLERRAGTAYSRRMNDTSQPERPPDWDPPMPSEAELLAALARSDADLAAGRVVPAAVVHAELAAARALSRRPAIRPA